MLVSKKKYNDLMETNYELTLIMKNQDTRIHRALVQLDHMAPRLHSDNAPSAYSMRLEDLRLLRRQLGVSLSSKI